MINKTVNKAKIVGSLIPPKKKEGVGATVTRVLPNRLGVNMDPFLMMDYASVRLPGGFPDHPHRGFETITYVIDGALLHEDFKGHKGRLEQGDVQWMTAGKGIVHAEMPESYDKDSVAFQLWLNLAKKDKVCEPRYQEFKKKDIPFVNKPGFTARVISGSVFDVKGNIEARTPTHFIDFGIENNKTYNHEIPAGWNSFLYIYQGSLIINEKEYEQGRAVFFEVAKTDTEVSFKGLNKDSKVTHFVWVSGLPIKETVVQYGPFVMNTQKEIYQAFEDYEERKNGFESLEGWRSKISELSKNK